MFLTNIIKASEVEIGDIVVCAAVEVTQEHRGIAVVGKVCTMKKEGKDVDLELEILSRPGPSQQSGSKAYWRLDRDHYVAAIREH